MESGLQAESLHTLKQNPAQGSACFYASVCALVLPSSRSLLSSLSSLLCCLLLLLLLSLFIESYCMHHNHTDVGESVGVLLQGDPHVPEGVDEPCDVTPVPPIRVHQGR